MSGSSLTFNQSLKICLIKLLVLFCLIKYIYSFNTKRSGCEAVHLDKNYVNQALV